MINLLSIHCGVAFAPYLLDGIDNYLRGDSTISRVFRQAASGMIFRADGDLCLRHQGREAMLNRGDAQHFFSTIRFRSEFYDVVRGSDEVILASVGDHLLLSHPQSEMWIQARVIPALLSAFDGVGEPSRVTLPEWLTVSGGDGRLLLSDQRSGRWVLLGKDHFAEFERRQERLNDTLPVASPPMRPPTISIKGVTLHLQSAFKLAETLGAFAETGDFLPFEEMAPHFCLGVARTAEGMQVVDSNLKVAINAKEARKWVAIIRDELERLNARVVERGAMRTVFADVEQGRWVLQWGDEVLFSPNDLRTIGSAEAKGESKSLVFGTDDGFHLALEKSTGNCVALTAEEVRLAHGSAEPA